MIVFCDTSALVKLYAQEAHSDLMRTTAGFFIVGKKMQESGLVTLMESFASMPDPRVMGERITALFDAFALASMRVCRGRGAQNVKKVTKMG